LDALVSGLPTAPFSTVEGAKEHFWEWWSDNDAKVKGCERLYKPSASPWSSLPRG
jgi:hypothetical protein